MGSGARDAMVDRAFTWTKNISHVGHTFRHLAVAAIVGNEALSRSQAGPEDFLLLNKYMLQGLSCSSYMIKLHSGMHSSMNPRNDVMNHGYKIWSVTILRPDFILRDQDRKWKIQHWLLLMPML